MFGWPSTYTIATIKQSMPANSYYSMLHIMQYLHGEGIMFDTATVREEREFNLIYTIWMLTITRP